MSNLDCGCTGGCGCASGAPAGVGVWDTTGARAPSARRRDEAPGPAWSFDDAPAGGRGLAAWAKRYGLPSVDGVVFDSPFGGRAGAVNLAAPWAWGDPFPPNGDSSLPCAATPTTRLVFFTCPDAAFQTHVLGPFPLMLLDPQPSGHQFVGVPQMFLGAQETTVLWYTSAITGPNGGMHVASTAAFAQVIQQLEAAALAGADLEALRATTYEAFLNLGPLVLDGNTPSTCTRPTLTDEHFVFCGNRLHLFFTNRETGSPTGPLTLISHAISDCDWSARVALASVPGGSGFTSVDDAVDALYGSGRARIVALQAGLLNQSYLAAGQPLQPDLAAILTGIVEQGIRWSWALEPDCPLMDMAARFTMAECDPFDLPAELGTDSVQDPGGQLVEVEMNDPNVYRAADGTWVMHFHSQALGGLVWATAPSSVACATAVSPC